MLISDEYRELNKELHETNEAYGTSGHNHAEAVVGLANAMQTVDILDYGCGKGTLNSAIGIRLKEYDPAVPGKDDPPEPADLVVCTDVLEHIEPDCLDDVLDDIESLARRGVFLCVATREAKKVLADGRNAHLIVEGKDWWLPKLMDRWDIINFSDAGGEFIFVGMDK
jgi:2-polyprenyl-3-methyl-5-hydroxy-6-metoxy-1,4-benzoquinol methylase